MINIIVIHHEGKPAVFLYKNREVLGGWLSADGSNNVNDIAEVLKLTCPTARVRFAGDQLKAKAWWDSIKTTLPPGVVRAFRLPS